MEPQGSQKIGHLLKMVNLKKTLPTLSGPDMWMYLRVNTSYLKGEVLSETQLSFLYSYLMVHVDDASQA